MRLPSESRARPAPRVDISRAAQDFWPRVSIVVGASHEQGAIVDGRGEHDPRLLQSRTALPPHNGGPPEFDWRIRFVLTALLVERRTGGVLSARMTLFLLVSLLGFLVHFMVVETGRALGAPVWLSNGGAMLTTMSWSFMLNNGLAFRDQRLRGWAMWQGLLGFYVACLGGAMVGQAVDGGLHALTIPWWAAGAVGALVGAIWNYGAVQRLTWRRLTTAQRARALVASPARRKAP